MSVGGKLSEQAKDAIDTSEEKGLGLLSEARAVGILIGPMNPLVSLRFSVS